MELILALNDLLIIDETPPNVEIYIAVLDAGWLLCTGGLLDLLPPDCALQIQQIDEDWRTSAMEQPMDGMPDGW